jgi:ketosteroid isomerase-like protein
VIFGRPACCEGQQPENLEPTAMTLTIAPPRTDATTVCRLFEDWATGDASRLDTLVDEDVVVAPLLGLLFDREIYRGRDGLAAGFAETAARWHSLELTVEDVRPVDERLVASVRLVAGRHGMSTELAIDVACELRDGLIVSLVDEF